MSPLRRQSSFLPMPPSPTRGRQTKKRNPFRVSALGSPRYIPRPDSPAMTSSTLVGSRIPRKSRGSPVVFTPSQTGSAQVSHPSAPSSADKPLPSLPVLQVNHSSSPPKAQRTLVDAAVPWTPSCEEWPVLSPYDLNPQAGEETRINGTVDTTAYSHDFARFTRSSEQCELTAGVSDGPVPVQSLTCHEYEPAEKVSPSPFEDSLHTLCDEHATPVTTVQGLTTTDDDTLKDPVTHELAIPPRVSSRGASSTFSSPDSQIVKAAAAAVSRHRENISNDTRLPLSSVTGDQSSKDAQSQSRLTEAIRWDDEGHMPSTHTVPEYVDAHENVAPKRASTGSASLWSQAAGSSVDDEPQIEEPGYRTRRFSDHPLKSELGAVLRISDDADAILLGKDAPSIPEAVARTSVSKHESLSSSLLSVDSSRSGVVPAPKQKTNYSGVATELRFKKLPKHLKLQLRSTSHHSLPPQKGNHIVGERSSDVLRKPIATTPRSNQDSTTRLDPPTTGRSMTSPALVFPTSKFRKEASPSYARSTVASSRNSTMLPKHATSSRKPANSPSVESKVRGSDKGSKNNLIDQPSGTDNGGQALSTKKVKPKRSIKGMFHFRDTKEKAPPVPALPKRSSLIGNTWSDRFKGRATLSKNYQKSPKKTLRQPTSQNEQVSVRPMGNSSVEVTTASVSTPNVAQAPQHTVQPLTLSDTSNIMGGSTSEAVNKIKSFVDKSSALGAPSNRLRGLEIGEALLISLDACKQAQISAARAEQHARQAELDAKRSAVELGRVLRLCDGYLDEEAMQQVKGLLNNAWEFAFPASPSENPHPTSSAQ